MESKRRSLTKALSYRVIGTLVTAILVYGVTGQATLSFAIGIFDSVVKIIVYFLHERAWARIQFGRVNGTLSSVTKEPTTAVQPVYSRVESDAFPAK
jgi:uncharacterized membrane protein